MKASNVYLHPACTNKSRVIAALERQTRRTAVIVRRGQVVQLIQPSIGQTVTADDDYPPTAA